MKEKLKKINWNVVSAVLACILSLVRIYQVIDEMRKRKNKQEEIEQRLDMIDTSCSIMEGRISFCEKMLDTKQDKREKVNYSSYARDRAT